MARRVHKVVAASSEGGYMDRRPSYVHICFLRACTPKPTVWGDDSYIITCFSMSRTSHVSFLSLKQSMLPPPKKSSNLQEFLNFACLMTHIHAWTHGHTGTETQRHRNTDTQRHKKTIRDTEKQRHRHRHIGRDTDTQTQTETQTQMQTETWV